MDYAESEPVGKLLRLDSDLSVHTLDSGIICSNGPCWSPDGKTLYFANSFKKTIFAYDYDTATGDVRSRRNFATFAAACRNRALQHDSSALLYGTRSSTSPEASRVTQRARQNVQH